MDLTPENKQYIDGLSHYDLLSHWRFAPVGNKWFQGETGEYWQKRMIELKEKDPACTGPSCTNLTALPDVNLKISARRKSSAR